MAGFIEKITNATVGKVVDVVDKHLPLSPETKANLEKEILQIITSENQAYYAAAKDIITTEAQGNWLQRSWRPLLMMEIVFIVGFNYILTPVLKMCNLAITPLDLPGQLWTLMEIGIGGYIVGRSGEKVAEKILKKYFTSLRGGLPPFREVFFIWRPPSSGGTCAYEATTIGGSLLPKLWQYPSF